MLLDTQIQIHYRKSDQSATEGHFESALLSLESMMDLFEQLPEMFKDKYMRKKLKKADYTFSKIQRNCSISCRERVDNLGRWLERESI